MLELKQEKTLNLLKDDFCFLVKTVTSCIGTHK